MEKSPAAISSATSDTTSRQSSSRPSSRRTSGTNAFDSLPTPPPDPPGYSTGTSDNNNIFRYNVIRKDLTRDLHGLLKFGERQHEFQKRLKQNIWHNCPRQHKNKTANQESSPKRCECCEKLYQEYELIMEPLQKRLNASITTALAAYGSINQLDHLYKIWERYLSLERILRQKQYNLHYVDLLKRRLMEMQCSGSEQDSLGGQSTTTNQSDIELNSQELDRSLQLLETILQLKEKATTNASNNKISESKISRERSKSFAINESLHEAPTTNNMQPLLRRQSTFVDNKSKISKWTKVKAAFKWEKANVTASNEHTRNILTPNNTELARYLRVPSIPHGGSSPESAFSSSSGHWISESCTPGTMSSASSLDDLDNQKHSSKIKDMIKSHEGSLIKTTNPSINDDTMHPNQSAAQSLSGKVILRKKELQNVETDAHRITQSPKNRQPPSPLDLNIKKDLMHLNATTNFMRHDYELPPQDGTQSLNRTLRKINSSINSSVPSSPSKYLDFFAECESEEHSSSADISDTNATYALGTRECFEQQQREINRRYEILRIKLDNEFEAKRKEWNKMKASRGMALLSGYKTNETALESNISNWMNKNVPHDIFEENVTSDFRKKLQKWRVKKQASIGGIQSHSPTMPISVQDNQIIVAGKDSKIDWQLWKTGQLKLEGQGLTPLPDQKDLPEEFQKKLEEWDKIKRGGSSASCNDSAKRPFTSKYSGHAISNRKNQSDDDKKSDKHKVHDKEKLERLAKLKAIVVEHPAKKIEVKTSAGVMKFEGISRKFTRKLYEWEKARGIGPESSTFALLHPGYCPIDVKGIKSIEKRENSPNLSHSLSLDSLAPTLTISGMSHQASSLSLNDINDLKDIKETTCNVNNSTDNIILNKVFDEPEAVMVEVEDHIEETASELITPIDLNQRPQNAICKYEENACNDFCNTKKVHSFDGNINIEPLLNALKSTEELLDLFKTKLPNITENNAYKQCLKLVTFIRYNYSYYSDNLNNFIVLNSISDVQNELSRLRDLSIKAPLDEACCKEIMDERYTEYDIELQGLHDTLQILRQNIQGNDNENISGKYNLPDINIISEDESNIDHKSCVDQQNDNRLSEALDAIDKVDTNISIIENQIKPATPSNTFAGSNNNGVKKRVRLRKVSSLRQNSKSDSDSSDADLNRRMIIGTPRRYKRKNYRFKQRSFDDDPKAFKKSTYGYELKCKPENKHCNNLENYEKHYPKKLNSETTFISSPITMSISLPNVFVKTKRKVFTTIAEPNAINGVTVIEHEIPSSPCEKMTNPENMNEKCVCMSTPQSKERLEQETHGHEVKTDLDALLRPRLVLVHKSLSLDDIRGNLHSDSNERVTQSAENVNNNNNNNNNNSNIINSRNNSKSDNTKQIRQSLASDSFRLLYNTKKLYNSNIDSNGNKRTMLLSQKEHLYKKHNEETTKSTIKMGIIETKIAKSQSINVDKRLELINNMSIEDAYKKDTILSEMEASQMPQLTNQNYHHCFDRIDFEHTSKSIGSRTPLNERALRLKKAKEDFLNNYYHRAINRCSAPEVENLRQNLHSHESNLSLSSTVGDDDSSKYSASIESKEESIDMQRSISADTVRPETPAICSDTGTEIEYDESVAVLQRPVRRCKNITSKFGFSTLASKFRKVRVGGKKSTETGKTNASALTVLCRQSLLADIIAVPQAVERRAILNNNNDRLMKSKSSPTNSFFWCASSGSGTGPAITTATSSATGTITPIRMPSATNTNVNVTQADRLNKSLSEQYVKRQRKESFV